MLTKCRRLRHGRAIFLPDHDPYAKVDARETYSRIRHRIGAACEISGSPLAGREGEHQMPAQRPTGRALTIMGALLLSSALAAPAYAEIEEIVVTAQKRAEDIQTVPIAITAFTSQDLQA